MGERRSGRSERRGRGERRERGERRGRGRGEGEGREEAARHLVCFCWTSVSLLTVLQGGESRGGGESGFVLPAIALVVSRCVGAILDTNEVSGVF